MNNYSDLFEKMNEQETPEDTLQIKIAQEITQLVNAMKREYWFHEDTMYSESSVFDWIKENRPEFYRKALEQPETVEGSDILTIALEALDFMKDWTDVGEKDIQTLEDEERWKGALGNRDEE